MTERPIGLIAGNRDLPLLVARKARALSRPVVAVGIEGETREELRDLVSSFTKVRLGQLRALIEALTSQGVRQVMMIGGISRDSIMNNYEPDELAVEVLEALPDFHTDRLLRAVAAKMEEFGLILVSAVELLPELLPPAGVLTAKAPAPELLEDLKVAWRIARELGRLDVGQCVVVQNKITLALETAEGTDETVRRGAALSREPVAVAKIVKPHQDLRLDLPVVGPETIRVMVEAGVGALAIDAGRMLVIDLDECVRLADEAGLAIVAWFEPGAGD